MLPVKQPTSWPQLDGVERQTLAGSQTGITSCRIGLVRLGHAAGETLSCDEERLIVVLEGMIVIGSGTERVVLRRHDAIFLPRSYRAELRNPEYAPAQLFEVLGPAPDIAEASPTEPASLLSLVRRIGDGSALGVHKGHGAQTSVQSLLLAGRSLGSESLRVFAALSPPGTGVDYHIHAFDQFYWILDGRLEIAVGTEKGEVGSGALVTFAAAVVHRNANATDSPVLQLTINAPEAPEGQAASIAVRLMAEGLTA